jgi:hypothetical protein
LPAGINPQGPHPGFHQHVYPVQQAQVAGVKNMQAAEPVNFQGKDDAQAVF